MTWRAILGKLSLYDSDYSSWLAGIDRERSSGIIFIACRSSPLSVRVTSTDAPLISPIKAQRGVFLFTGACAPKGFTVRSQPEGPCVRAKMPLSLFSSLLDLIETKSEAVPSPEEPRPDCLPKTRALVAPLGKFMSWGEEEESLAVAFRHAAWRGEREKMARALWEASYDTAAVNRFLRCGDGGHVLVAADGNSARVVSYNCKSRFCEPCLRDKSFHIRRKLAMLMGDEFHRFITLTLRGNQKSLEEVRRHLQRSMDNLRATQFWKQSVTGGAWFTEITRGARGDHWHVHAHAIVSGTWMDLRELIAVWKIASGGSFRVDIEAVTDGAAGARYVSKYSTKGIGRELSRYPTALVEAIRVLKGKRMIGTFGTWWGADLEVEEEERAEEKDVGTIGAIIKGAISGEAWAVGIMLQLKRQVLLDRGKLRYRWISPAD